MKGLTQMFDETKNENGADNQNEVINENEVSSEHEENSPIQSEVVLDCGELFEDEGEKSEEESENTDENNEEDIIPAEDLDGGIGYTKTENGSLTNCYEWNPDKGEGMKAKKSSSGKGFKVFLAVILSVFTLSVITMAAVVIHYIFSVPEEQEVQTQKHTSSLAESTNRTGYITSSPNYVSRDFAEFDGKTLSIPEIAAKCTPSSVGIISEVEVSYINPFYLAPSTAIGEASGSGFIYSAEGHVITNHHVIEDAKKITVVLYDGSRYEAKVIGSDSLSDVALLKIDVPEDVTLIPMELGNSDDLIIGEPVVAIGCPAGIEFIGTVTDGIISAIGRDIKLGDDNGTSQKIMTLIQTNATINHGNSGGPLINSRGQVIGINTLKLAKNYEGIGFSIPINGAVSIISQLMEHGKVIERTEDDFVSSKGIIGINGAAISKEESVYYGIPEGVLVVQIDKESSASKNGLRRGDIITHYNGKEVRTLNEINAIKGNAKAGSQATVTVYRVDENNNGRSFDISFTLGAQE